MSPLKTLPLVRVLASRGMSDLVTTPGLYTAAVDYVAYRIAWHLHLLEKQDALDRGDKNHAV